MRISSQDCEGILIFFAHIYEIRIVAHTRPTCQRHVYIVKSTQQNTAL